MRPARELHQHRVRGIFRRRVCRIVVPCGTSAVARVVRGSSIGDVVAPHPAVGDELRLLRRVELALFAAHFRFVDGRLLLGSRHRQRIESVATQTIVGDHGRLEPGFLGVFQVLEFRGRERASRVGMAAWNARLDERITARSSASRRHFVLHVRIDELRDRCVSRRFARASKLFPLLALRRVLPAFGCGSHRSSA